MAACFRGSASFSAGACAGAGPECEKPPVPVGEHDIAKQPKGWTKRGQARGELRRVGHDDRQSVDQSRGPAQSGEDGPWGKAAHKGLLSSLYTAGEVTWRNKKDSNAPHPCP